MTGTVGALISGDALKDAANRFAVSMQGKIEAEQAGTFNIFDKWFARIFTRLMAMPPDRPWEQGVAAANDRALDWDFLRLRLFLDRWDQGRYVPFSAREASRLHYHPDYGTEFGTETFLTCQGAPALMRWRGLPMMKTVFDFAIYPMLLAELRPATIIEIGSGLGVSGVWLGDHLALFGIEGHVHSVDIVKAELEHPFCTFVQGDCTYPDRLFDPAVLTAAPRPWLVIEDAHHNVEGVLDWIHPMLQAGDYLIVEDTDVKRRELAGFDAKYPGAYLVDTKYTDYFGRNATCSNDSILVRTGPDGRAPEAIEG